MMELVRNGPGMEAPDPNFDVALPVVRNDLRHQMTASPCADDPVRHGARAVGQRQPSPHDAAQHGVPSSLQARRDATGRR